MLIALFHIDKINAKNLKKIDNNICFKNSL